MRYEIKFHLLSISFEIFVFSMMDVYPSEFDRMKNLNPPGDRKLKGASFGTRFGCHSLSKTTSFLMKYWKKTQNTILDVYPSFFDRMTMKLGPDESYG